MEKLPDAMVVINERGLIRSFSAAAERLFGYTAEEVLGERTEPLHPVSEIARLARLLGVPEDFSAVAARLMHPDMAGTEIAFVRKDGEVRTLPNEAVIVCAGGILPTPFLKKLGIDVDTKYGTE